jgi:hypothetical protein
MDNVDVPSQCLMGLARSSGVEQRLREDDAPAGILVVNLDADWLTSDKLTTPVPNLEAIVTALTDAYRTWQAAAPVALPASPSASLSWVRERDHVRRVLDAEADAATMAFALQVRTLWLDHVMCYLLHDYRRFLHAERGIDLPAYVARFPSDHQAYVQVQRVRPLYESPRWLMRMWVITQAFCTTTMAYDFFAKAALQADAAELGAQSVPIAAATADDGAGLNAETVWPAFDAYLRIWSARGVHPRHGLSARLPRPRASSHDPVCLDSDEDEDDEDENDHERQRDVPRTIEETLPASEPVAPTIAPGDSIGPATRPPFSRRATRDAFAAEAPLAVAVPVAVAVPEPVLELHFLGPDRAYDLRRLLDDEEEHPSPRGSAIESEGGLPVPAAAAVVATIDPAREPSKVVRAAPRPPPLTRRLTRAGEGRAVVRVAPYQPARPLDPRSAATLPIRRHRGGRRGRNARVWVPQSCTASRATWSSYGYALLPRFTRACPSTPSKIWPPSLSGTSLVRLAAHSMELADCIMRYARGGCTVGRCCR